MILKKRISELCESCLSNPIGRNGDCGESRKVRDNGYEHRLTCSVVARKDFDTGKLILADPLQQIVEKRNLKRPIIWNENNSLVLKHLDAKTNSFLPAIRISRGNFIEL